MQRALPRRDPTARLHTQYSTTHTAGDVIFARLRRPSDDSLAALLHPRRRRHPLATAFRTVDARSYSEIATVDVERAVLDLALDPTDSYLAVVSVDIGGDTAAVGSSVRMFEVGRHRPAMDDESDEGDDAEDEDEEEVSGCIAMTLAVGCGCVCSIRPAMDDESDEEESSRQRSPQPHVSHNRSAMRVQTRGLS